MVEKFLPKCRFALGSCQSGDRMMTGGKRPKGDIGTAILNWISYTCPVDGKRKWEAGGSQCLEVDMGIRLRFYCVPIALFGVLVAAISSAAPADPKDANTAESVAVTILSSNLADWATVGEWGFLR